MDRTAWNDTQEEGLRLVVPLLAGLSVVCAIASAPGTAAQNVVAALAAVPFFLWAFAWRGMPALLLMVLTCAAAGFSLETGQLEPLLFLVCVAANVVGGWEPSTRALVAGTVLACATPVLIEVFHDDDILYGVWIMGITLSLLLPRTFRWQLSLVTQLAEAREELAHQAVLEEKRAIARDVHDLVGHGLAAVMLHVTGARHVLRRDPDAADEALAEAEAVGRRSLQELRRTIGLLRAGDPPTPVTARGLTPDLASAAVQAAALGADRAAAANGGDAAGGAVSPRQQAQAVEAPAGTTGDARRRGRAGWPAGAETEEAAAAEAEADGARRRFGGSRSTRTRAGGVASDRGPGRGGSGQDGSGGAVGVGSGRAEWDGSGQAGAGDGDVSDLGPGDDPTRSGAGVSRSGSGDGLGGAGGREGVVSGSGFGGGSGQVGDGVGRASGSGDGLGGVAGREGVASGSGFGGGSGGVAGREGVVSGSGFGGGSGQPGNGGGESGSGSGGGSGGGESGSGSGGGGGRAVGRGGVVSGSGTGAGEGSSPAAAGGRRGGLGPALTGSRAVDVPVPGVRDLPDAVASARAAGLEVTLRAEGDLDRVDPVVGLSLHRVAEAALANARQHAPAAVTDVSVRVGPGDVVMVVESLGPLREPDPADADRPRYGLIGMRERMAAVGGELEAAPTSSGWRVRARVPLAEEPA